MTKFKTALVSFDVPKGIQREPQWVRDEIENEGVTLLTRQCRDSREVIELAADADLVWVYGGGRFVTADVLHQLPRCIVILRSGSGTDNIPVKEATELGILVANTPQATVDPVSDHVIALLFSILHWVPKQDRAIRAGIWDRDHAWPDWHIRGSTVGFIGFGRIPGMVVQKLGGFEVSFVAYDPFVSADAMGRAGVRKAELNEVLSEADIISVHTPLTDQTRHLLSDAEFDLMKSKAIFINTSRGPVVDEAALARALQDGKIGAAGLDVFEKEPLPADSPLRKLENVVLTPHSAGYDDRIWHEFWRYSVRTVIDVSKGFYPASYVNPHVTPRGKFTKKGEA
jgi:D-3-phosphoglycerate dehydrogenase